ncbi:MAG: hypothetical protein LBS56_07480 [Propionibacteriaceae bacterium]|nr:hypothetical protein [Propionibacteriaceae bacterium]
MPLASGKGETGIFDLNSPGLQTNRDAWVYSFSERVLRAQVAGIVETYNADVARLDGTPQEDRGGLATKDPAKISWSSSLLQRLARGDRLSVRDGQFVIGSYRPFNRQRVYFADTLNHRVGKMPQFFPTREHSNTGFVLTGISSHYDFSLMAVDAIPDLHLLDTGVCFPRWRYEPIPDADGPAAAGAGTQGALDLAGVPGRASGGDDAATDPADAGAQGALDLAGVGRAGRENEAAADSTGAGGADQAGAAQGEGGGGGAGADEAGDGIVHGYRRIDNITDAALAAFRHAYGRRVTKDDVFHYVYGLLHSADYRREFGADLKKSLPRVPLVASREAFEAFAAAGRELMALHLGYEQAEPWPDLAITGDHPDGDPHAWYRVEKMRYATAGKAKDKTAVVYNPRITVSGIPPEAQDYLLGARSAIDWILERYQVKTDKASGIVNDPNDWSLEHGAPRHILDLLTRVVTVSARTVEITAGLPPLSSSDRDVTTHVDDRRQGDQP